MNNYRLININDIADIKTLLNDFMKLNELKGLEMIIDYKNEFHMRAAGKGRQKTGIELWPLCNDKLSFPDRENITDDYVPKQLKRIRKKIMSNAV